MARINLLPWREELRKQKLQEFAIVLGMVAVAAVVLGFGWNLAAQKSVDYQKSRNSYIQTQIAEMDESIKEIEELQRRRDALIDRMNVIQGLQGNRPAIVYVFDEFVNTLPDGVHYTSLKQVGNKFEVVGMAESNNRISNLMRNLEASPWFAKPALSKVVASGAMFEFALSLQVDPAAMGKTAEPQEKEKKPSKGKKK